jgi:hypothetical protein
MDLDITVLQRYLSNFVRIQKRERLTWGIEAEHPVGMVPAADTDTGNHEHQEQRTA